jgi:hypothetical protein
VKNRFLMRIKNCTPALYRRYWLPMTARDLMVVGGCLLSEPSSLPAFWHLARCLGRAIERRRTIMARRRVDDAALTQWLSCRELPSAEPLVAAEARSGAA